MFTSISHKGLSKENLKTRSGTCSLPVPLDFGCSYRLSCHKEIKERFNELSNSFHSSSDDLDGIEELSQTVVCNKKQKSNSKGASAGITSKRPKVGGRIKSRAQDSSSSSESDLLGSPPPVANARKTDNNQVVKSNTIAGREQIPQQGMTTISVYFFHGFFWTVNQ